MLIIYIALAWAAGIILTERFVEDVDGLSFVLVAGALIGLWIRLYIERSTVRRLSLLLLWFCAGGLWLNFNRPAQDDRHVSHFNGEEHVVLEGIIRDEPVKMDTFTRVRLDVDVVEFQNRRQGARGDVLLTLFTDEALDYGDRLRVRGLLLPPPELDTFSYNEYLARSGVFSIMRTDTVSILDRDEGSPLRSALLDVKKDARNFIEDALPEPQSGLLVGILLGDESRLSEDVEGDFNTTGTSHIIAISGFNMTLIAGVISAVMMALLRRRTAAVTISLIVILIYTLFVGAGAGVARAAIMSGLLIVGPLVYRRTYVPASLAAAAIAMSFLNPYVLWDIGFQLSFAAVMGMAILTPPGDRWLRERMEVAFGKETGTTVANWLSEPLIVTLAAQLATLPIILHYFGQVSPISPLANFLIIPVQPLILVFGALGTLLSFVSPGIGELFYQVAWLLLTYTIETVRALADAAPTVNLGIPVVVMWTGFGLLVAYVILNAKRPLWWEGLWREQGMWKPVVQYAPLVLGLFLLAGIGQRLVNQPDDRLHVIFLDMGHSNSVLIRTPDGGAMLIDGGRFPSRLLTALGDYLPPNKESIDVLFVTGDEAIDVLPDVMERYDVQALVYNPLQGEVQPAYNTVLDGIDNKIAAQAGWRVRTGDGVEIEILSPDGNAASMVLRLTYGGAVFLFTNDMRSSQEEILLENPHLVQANVLQVANHGALRTNSDIWIDTVNPQVAVLQSDPASSQNPTEETVIARFEDRRLFRTDEDGVIEIVTDGEELEIISSE